MKHKIEVASNVRGFLDVLFHHRFNNIEFISKVESYEIYGTKHKLLRSVFESKIFDLFGVIQVLKKETKYEAMITYNRFMRTTSPYYVICENPTSLFHYRLKRNKGLFARFILPNRLKDTHLKGIICMSEACKSTFNNIHGITCDKLYQIYPLIKDTGIVREFNDMKPLNCLFVSSAFELKSGCEIVQVAKVLPNVKFTLITRASNIPKNYLTLINELPNIELVEFKLTKEELATYYKDADLLLHVTRQDSSPLVVLEAIKYGLPVLATELYAIPEMVIDGYNGFMTAPRYFFFNRDNMPNPKVWNNRKKTIYSHYLDDNIISFLIEKIRYFDENRDRLLEFSLNSLKIVDEKFGEKKIQEQWEQLINNTLHK